MGPRIREDNGRARTVREPPLRERMMLGTGFTPIPRLYGGGRFAGKREWCAGITVGLGGRVVREPPLREKGEGARWRDSFDSGLLRSE